MSAITQDRGRVRAVQEMFAGKEDDIRLRIHVNFTSNRITEVLFLCGRQTQELYQKGIPEMTFCVVFMHNESLAEFRVT